MAGGWLSQGKSRGVEKKSHCFRPGLQKQKRGRDLTLEQGTEALDALLYLEPGPTCGSERRKAGEKSRGRESGA